MTSNAKPKRKNVRRWSRKVTERSDAMDLEAKVFTRTPRAIALSLKRSAERSQRSFARQNATPARIRIGSTKRARYAAQFFAAPLAFGMM